MSGGVRYTVGEILRRHLAEYERGHRLSWWQRKILHALMVCRTAALGGHVRQCEKCGHEEVAYNSCHNRHCPTCLGMSRSRWVKARMQELLPVPYYHLVFTLPHRLNTLALYNKQLLYNLFYQAVSYTLCRFGRDAGHLGAEIGFIAVLHTWGKALATHIHWHVIMAGGGLSKEGTWRALPYNEKFAFPVHALSAVVRGRFLKLLRRAYESGQLTLPRAEEELGCGHMFEHFLNDLARDEWVTYAKRPFGGPEQVLKYLGRYTHRVALSNRRILGISQGQVQLAVKNYRRGGCLEVVSLSAQEFIRRYLHHTLPRRFRKIRYGGFMVCTVRQKKLALARHALGVPDPSYEPGQDDHEMEDSGEWHKCPQCVVGRMKDRALPGWVVAKRAGAVVDST